MINTPVYGYITKQNLESSYLEYSDMSKNYDSNIFHEKMKYIFEILSKELGFNLDFIRRVLDYFGINDFKSFEDLHNLFINEIIPLKKEIQNLVSGNIDISDISIEFNDFYRLISGDSTFPVISDGISFGTYEYEYETCNNVWHGDTKYFWYNMYPIKSNTYYDWTRAVDALMTKLFWGSFIIGFISGAIIYFGNDIMVDLFGLIFLSILLIYDASFMVYAYNSCLHFDICQNNQPDLLVHIIDQEGESIDNYDGIITAYNLDAIKVCDKEDEDDTVWQEHFFTYILGPEDSLIQDSDCQGWYSLSNRHFNENIFEKAPCPPGNWTISVGSTSEWEGRAKSVYDVRGMQPIIVEIQLDADN